MRGKLYLDATGWISQAVAVPSPNFDQRTDYGIDLLVVHAISLPPGEFGGDGIEALFTNRLDPDEDPFYREIHDLRVSAHFLIRRDGKLLQFVSVYDRAWHAGVSSFDGKSKCNDFSIGVELEGCDELRFEAEQYSTLVELTSCLQVTFERISNQRIAGHQTIAPGRKTDPGPHFDWPRYLGALAKR